MPSTSNSLLNYLRVVIGVWRDDPRDDAELLARFAEARDEGAFATLVGRHGALVWRTCQRILGDTPDAEDAFQATFLALARKAGRFPVESLVGWLHQVARRTALNAEASAQRRRNLEQRLQTVPQPPAEGDADRAELYAALDEELAGLPGRLRIPLVLRYLEGKTLEEVARIVGCSRRAVGKQLERGEAILRKRLEQRGLAMGLGSVAVLLGSSTTASAVPMRLIGSTARAAVAFRSGTLTSGAAEAARAMLGALPSLETTIMRKSLWIMLACTCSLGVGLAVWQAPESRSDTAGSPEPASLKEAAESGSGRVDRFGDPLPTGALARLGTLRLRHAGTAVLPDTAGANSVVFSQDGKMLITAGPNNPIRVWDAATGKLLHFFGDIRSKEAVSIALSQDGHTLATVHANDNGVAHLWEVTRDKLLHQLSVGGDIFAVGFSRDGRTLLSAPSDNRRIRVWTVPNGKVLRDQPLMADKARNHSGSYISIFSPDGKTVASIVLDRVGQNRGGQKHVDIVHLWETATGKELRHLPLGKGKGKIPRGAVAFSPDSRFLAVGSLSDSENVDNRSDGAVHLWEVSTGKEVRKLTADKTGTYSVAFSPDSKVLATGSGFGPIRLWEVATGKELRQCQGYRAHVVGLAFSPDGSTLASLAGLHDHTARLWEVASGKERTRTSGGHVGPVLSVAFSPDGKSLISGGRDGLVAFWDAQTGKEQRSPLRIGDFQALAALSPDGKTFLTVSNIFSPNVHPDLQEVALKTPSVVCVWDRATGQKLREFKGGVGAPQSLTLSPDGKVLLWNSWNRVYLMEVATGKVMKQFFADTFEPKCAAFSPDGKTLAVYFSEEGDSGGKATVHFYETATGKELGSIQAHDTRPWCLAVSPDGQTFALGGMKDTSLRLWRVQRSKKAWKEAEKLVGHQAEILALAFSHDSKTLASASQDGTVRLWEVATGEERRRFAGHGGEVWCLAFAPDGRRLAAGGNDTAVLVWDVTGRLQNGQLRPVKLTDKEVKGLWNDLAEAARAGQAVWTLAAAPVQAIPLLKEHLRPVAPAEPRIARLIADLDSDDFAVRQKAMDELAKLGEVAEPALCQALAKSASLEMRRRLEQLLEQLKEKFPLSREKLRLQRALEVLEQIGTPEALPLLQELAQGAPGAHLTLEAQAILNRLRTRAKAAQP